MSERDAIEMFMDPTEVVINTILAQRTDIDEETKAYVAAQMRKDRDSKKNE